MPVVQPPFERVYDQKQHSTQNKPMVRQLDWSIKNSGSDLRKQYASNEKAMNENMTGSKSKMKFEDKSSIKQKIASKNGELNKTMDAGRQKINVEKAKIERKVNKRAENGTIVTVGKQIKENFLNGDSSSDGKE